MTGTLPYEGMSADYAIMCRIFEGPLSQVNGESRLSDCVQVWELMTRCWVVNPDQRPTANMCKTIVTYLPRCTPALHISDHSARGPELLENLGDLETWKGNIVESFKYLNEALRLYEGDGNIRGVASVLNKQAAAWERASDFPKLQATATTALEHCRNLNDARGIADASSWLGYSLHVQGQRDKALPILRESLEIYRTHGNDVGATSCLARIAEIQRYGLQPSEALATSEEAMTFASRSGDRLGVAKALLQIGVAHYDLSDLGKASDAFSRAFIIAQKIGWKLGVANALGFMGNIMMREGEYRKAEELLLECVSMARNNDLRWQVAQGLLQLGTCFKDQGKLREAALAWEESCALYQEMLWFDQSTDLATILAELKHSQGEWDSALFWYDQLITISRSQNKQRRVAQNLEKKGEILMKVKRYDEAALHIEAAFIILAEGGYMQGYSRRRLERRLAAIPVTVMRWERRLPLLCDVKRLQRRLPQLVTASLKLPISPTSAKS